MKKLQLEALEVSSFETMPTNVPLRGTMYAHGGIEPVDPSLVNTTGGGVVLTRLCPVQPTDDCVSVNCPTNTCPVLQTAYRTCLQTGGRNCESFGPIQPINTTLVATTTG